MAKIEWVGGEFRELLRKPGVAGPIWGPEGDELRRGTGSIAKL